MLATPGAMASAGSRSRPGTEARARSGRKHEAHQAIEEAYGLSDRPDTLGEYAATWTERHPRAERTNATYDHRISRVADVEIDGIPLKDWPLRELRRRHVLALVDHMLRLEGRATTGAVGILRALSAMAEDAITDEVCDLNPFKGVCIRANDPRAKKKPRPIRVFSFEEMHRFARRPAATRRWSASSPTPGWGWGRCPHFAAKTSTARRSKSVAPPTRDGSSREPRPTTASPTPAGSFPSRRPSPGCSKPRSS